MKEVRTVKRLFPIFLVVILALGLFIVASPHDLAMAQSTTELSYDDNQLDIGWGTGPVGGGAVLFTPPTIPWVLSTIKVMAAYTEEDAPFYIEIWDSNQNELFNQTYMYSDYFTSSPAWAEIEMPDIVVQGDFYVCVFPNFSANHKLWLQADTDPPVSWRSFAVRYDNNAVAYVEEWNWMIRAIGASSLPADIDIKPGSSPNSVNCKNEKGVIAVAILTTDGFDATTVDHTTVTFEGAGETHTNKKSGKPKRHEEDVDGDGDTDLVFHFRFGDTNLTCDSTEGTLTGETFDGMPIEGTDSIAAKGKKPDECYAPVPKTGQTGSYSDYDDGYYQKGVICPEPRFTDNEDGTVTDNCTGLIWLKDANCFGLRTWSDALGDSNGLADGNCGLTDGSVAGDWYLPNVKQLQSLVHHGFHDPVIPNTTGTDKWTEGDPFFAVQSHLYWSSTTDSGKTSDALFVNIDRGGMSNANKASSHYVWPVRGGN